MNKYAIKLLIVISLSGVSCKDKKHCDGSNSISGVVKNGTTMQPVKNVPLSFTLCVLDNHGQTTEAKDVGTIMTDDSGRFHFEYSCQEKDFDKIVIESQPPYTGYLHASEEYTKHLSDKVYYIADDGSAQITLQDKTPLSTDSLFVTYGYADGSGGVIWVYRDSFTVGTVPKYWKKIRGPKGAGRFVFWDAASMTLPTLLTRIIKIESLSQLQAIRS